MYAARPSGRLVAEGGRRPARRTVQNFAVTSLDTPGALAPAGTTHLLQSDGNSNGAVFVCQ